MDPFTFTQWVVLALVLLFGLFLGMAIMAGGKWKRRYRDEHARVAELERENEALRRDAREMDSLRGAAARHPPSDREERGPL